MQLHTLLIHRQYVLLVEYQIIWMKNVSWFFFLYIYYCCWTSPGGLFLTVRMCLLLVFVNNPSWFYFWISVGVGWWDQVLMTRIYSADTSEIFIFLDVRNSQSWACLSAVTEFKHHWSDFCYPFVNSVNKLPSPAGIWLTCRHRLEVGFSLGGVFKFACLTQQVVDVTS